MLNDADIARYRDALHRELQVLDDEDKLGRDGQATVELDQQSVGRLSRMDAMQQQAMAQATQRRRIAQRGRIDAALRRIEEGEFGYCSECGEDIAPARLDLDPAVPSCLSCARG